MWRAEQGERVRIPDEAALAVALPNVVTMDLRFSSVHRYLISKCLNGLMCARDRGNIHLSFLLP
jgi:hypothetical protein